MAEAYPLHWPAGWPRTEQPQQSRFDVSFTAARDGLMEQIRLLNGRYPVLSTNIELRRDGLPYSNQRSPEDTGVAVYFERKGKQMVFACDRWKTVKDNMRAIQKTIEAMRGIERWGASDMLERAFSAFEALPAPGATARRSWREVLGFPPSARPDREGIEVAYRSEAKRAHPDAGGSTEAFTELQQARDEALRAVGGS
ncbi:J domain-containing protein [Aquamicrobium sp. LC103]|uniref:J domain-containing protein n=1 Tax=Aquamicrobium sp. LC103 TaxID=1120658 RepID=UPI00063EAE89|nr:J domain-containing protein [Aquamicrobium sp. LC103]TKT80028.1 J domain-containing protein [Aquamicrobium sp. LC103]